MRRSTADIGHSWAALGGGHKRYICQPGYMAGLIYGPQGPRYNRFLLYSVYFMLLTLSGRCFIKIQYSSFPLLPVAYPFSIAMLLQYYVKREKCKVNIVIFPSGCEARAINLGNKNMKSGIFTSATSVISKNIFNDISQYSTGKHEIKLSHIVLIKLPSRICTGVTHCFRFDRSILPLTLTCTSINIQSIKLKVFG